MTKFELIKISNAFNGYSAQEIELAFASALALTPYIKYADDYRAYFFGITNKVAPLMNQVNEVVPFDLDAAKRNAFALFTIRYNEVVRPTVGLILDKESKAGALFASFCGECDMSRVSTLAANLLTTLQQIVKESFVEKAE